MDIGAAIVAICKDNSWDNPQISINAEDYEQITYYDGNPNNITVEQIKAKQVELKEEYDSQAYSRARAMEYPSLESVTVALAEKAEGNSAMWDEITKQRQAVKAKHPK
jgi:hypothetical protein